MTIRSKGVKVTRFLRRSLLAFAGVLSLLFAGSVFKIMLAAAIAATAYFIPGTGNIISFLEAPRTAPSIEAAEAQLIGLNDQPITGTRTSYYAAAAIGMDQSVKDGAAELDEYFRSDEFKADSAQGTVYVPSYSQGDLVVQEWLRNYADKPGAPSTDSVEFISFGAPSTYNGGVTNRLNPFWAPFVGRLPGPVTDSGYKVTSVSWQYDVFADFLKNPANLLALANGIAGFVTHTQGIPADKLDDPRNVVTKVGNTTYITVYNERLPILEPLYKVKFLDPVLAHIVDPALRVLIETAYDRSSDASPGFDLTYGSTDPLTTTMKMAEAVIRGVYTLANGLPPQSAVKVEEVTLNDSSVDRVSAPVSNRPIDDSVESVDSQSTDEIVTKQEEQAEETTKVEAPRRDDVPAKTEEVETVEQQVTNEPEVSEQSEKLSKMDQLKQKREERRQERQAKREEAKAAKAETAAKKDADEDDDSSKEASDDSSNSATPESGDDKAAA